MRNALVPLAPLRRDTMPASTGERPSADFIAHLIAMSSQAPQTRVRRRAEPKVAVAAYRALGQWPTLPGRTVSRSL